VSVAKFSGVSGAQAWAKEFSSLNGGTTDFRELTIDAAGNVAVTGNFIGSYDFGGGLLENFNDPGHDDSYVVALDPAGNHLYSATLSGSDEQLSYDLDVDQEGHFFAAGYFESSLDFNGKSELQGPTFPGLGFLVKILP
jgi:hypothetical protein